MTLELLTIPCLTDNYAYLWRDTGTDTTVAVDVPEAAPLMRVLAERGWQLHHILLTHHHGDHIAGAEALAQATGAKIVGAMADAHRLPSLDHPVRPGEVLQLGTEEVFVMPADGHTIGHVAYHLPGAGLLFSGDSLMSWGCGRLFEGSPAQMHETLTRFAALPRETRICSGHEYTLANGRFALSLEPEHPTLLQRMARCEALRAEGKPTLPVALAEELNTNPFLRGADPALCAALGLPEGTSPLTVFTEARARKDRF
ncbi:hydroxyacylglutathione hydrolase [Rhodobacter sp. TJ_12]|uniref:hydroxyacylglutathione hydrolase n=1 Tax=Rhodobacter sp. TJ_12 TaxID=2029399 RepID=UPI001CBE5361|nr:hydroxyacylglutathione hydrolase [Rhodobacter sp. TJ_12]MBZ4023844.1 hydroxyacylglutathione hydrolase [Rhodobacter sp. TJ_12]